MADVLERLGRAAGVSRAYVFEKRTAPDGSPLVHQRYEWAAPGIVPQIGNPALQGFALRGSGLDRWEGALAAGDVIRCHIRELDEAERRPLEVQGILSIVLVPISLDGDWWGFVGFDECTRERTWTPPEIDALKAFGDIVGAAISRQVREARMAEAEAKYRALVEQIPAVVYLGEYGPDGAWLYVSPQIEDLLGYTAEEWLTGRPPPHTHPDDFAAVDEAEEESFRTGGPYRVECRMRTKDGRWIWVLDEARPVRDAEGRILFMQGVMTDVTARREEEETRVGLLLQLESERRLHRAMEDAHLACVSLDLEGRVTYCNRFLLGLTGWKAEEILGQDWWEVLAPDVSPAVRTRFLQDARAGSLAAEREGPVTTRAGDLRRISWSDTLVRDGTGVVVGVTMIGQDVTDHRAAQDRLRASERRFRALTDNGHDAITLVGPDGVIRYSSSSAERVFGYPAADVLEADAFDFVHPDDRVRVAELFAQIAGRPGASATAEFRSRHADGSWIWVESVAENRLSDPDVGAIVLNTRDVTERRLAEERLREAEEKYRTMVEQLPGIVYTDLIDGEDVANWPTAYISPQIERILGYTQDEWLGDPGLWARTVHPDDRDGALAADIRGLAAGRAVGSGSPAGTEYRMLAKDGRLVWLRDESVIVRDEEGTPRFQQGILTDVTEVKQAEAQARAAEARYRSLVQNLPVGFYIEPADDVVGPTSFASPQMHVISGHPSEAWVEDPGLSLRIVHEEDREAFIAAQHNAIGTGEPFMEEYRIVRPDGSVVWVHDEAVLVRDEDGVPLRWEGFMIDVTARRTAEERLREAEVMYRRLVENMPAASYVEPLEEDPDLFYMGPQITGILGYDPSEFLDRDFWGSRIHPDDRERVLTEEERANATGEPFLSEYRMIASDGRTVWVRDQAVLVRAGDTNPLFWQGFIIDVTERKLAEERLREAEAKYRTLVERVPAIVYTDSDTPISTTRYVSPQIEAVTGYTAADLVGDPELWREVIHPDDFERQRAAEVRAYETREPYSIEYRCVTRDGRIIWVEDRSAPVQDEDGRVLFWEGVMLDITRLKEAEEELTRALALEREVTERLRALDDMKDHFLTAVSHELRTPLTSVLGSAVTLGSLDGSLAAEDRLALITGITSGAKKLDRLIRDLLDMDRLSRGVLSPQRRPVDLAQVAERTIEESGLRPSREIRLEANDATANVDVAMAERILENLLVNAAKHTPPEARIWIRAAREAEGVLLAVEDDGPGVPVQARGRIFEPFLRGSDRPSHTPGVGVGLSLVAQFARLHGGRAWVEERAGGGASFRVFLPDTGSAAVEG